MSWQSAGHAQRAVFNKAVVEWHPHPKQPIALVYLANLDEDGDHGRVAANEVVLLDLVSGTHRTLAEDAAPVGWPEAVWSPDGSHLVTMESRFGPFLVLETERAGQWIRGEPVAMHRISARQFAAHEDHPAKVHVFDSWISADSFLFRGNCCGDTFSYLVELDSGRVIYRPSQ